MNKFYPLAAAFLLTAGSSFAQSSLPTVRSCGSMDLLARQLQQDPQMQQRMQEIEKHTRQFEVSRANQRTSAVVTIPVVVHVVYNTSAQNISDAQIQSQIDVLNRDFRKLNTDVSLAPAAFSGLAADAQIQFCLAQRDPSGNATTGITRTQTTKTSFNPDTDDVKSASTGGKAPWNSSQYLNLWVCNLSGGVLGYAQFPGGPAATDGVVILYTGFGTTGTAAAPFNKGRTATHEVGHWLNLRHIWADEAACGADDYVTDTPQQKDKNFGCPSYPQTTQAGGRCSTADPSSMFMNYMDYTDDACMYMFTTGQSNRMNAVLAAGGSRNSLTTSLGCQAPSGTTTCSAPTGLSATAVTSSTATLNWGAVTGASSYNVQVKAASSTTWSTFSAAGTSLNISGMSASTTYQFQVQTVCASGSSAYSAVYNFTTTAASGTGGGTFTVGTGTTLGTTTSNNTPYGTYYMDQRAQYIITKAELTAAGYTSGSSLTSLAFNGGTANSLVMNGFTIKVAHTTAASFGSSSFLTGTNTTQVYSANVTAASGWKTFTFGTPFTYNGTSNLLIEVCFNNSTYTSNTPVYYTNTSSYKANYYRADVSSGGVCANATGTLTYSRPNMRLTFAGGAAITVGNEQEEPAATSQRAGQTLVPVQLYPNPVTSDFNVQYTVAEDQQEVTIEVYTLLGALVKRVNVGPQTAGEHTFTMSAVKDAGMAQLSNGMYLCTVRSGSQLQTIPFILAK